ncbi:30S ribosomal protein S3 [Candidatus Pacearchaeota archaeon CG1_02_31_27]|nr:MAG: 30S ribosomal protein S3 [Candidatus Pacearchaeota archaeon CG1_02_31_27]PIN92364.1 MAG: 30S ribosomal protein S3 [Candidatus Pacearchaeota archaeon CG10_big_fil_rev_8_21_14_0_10_31_59]PIZ80666.1 MAG: 30S ribosomal protein S3 [Candidatus Pacearchaeota archaeon CG_4_10_14_0_2_um_filter_31_10]
MNKKFIETKKKEFAIIEYLKNELGKGKVSDIKINRTPLGDRIIIKTSKPGLIIGRRGEMLQKITYILKNKFKLENPQIDIEEIDNMLYDAQSIADQLALSMERFGPLSFKIIAYKMLQRLIDAKVLGVEIVFGGKLPSQRTKTWRFSYGYLKKTGNYSTTLVKRATATAFTKPGTIGIKVLLIPPETKIPDNIEIEKGVIFEEIKEEKPEKKKSKKK